GVIWFPAKPRVVATTGPEAGAKTTIFANEIKLIWPVQPFLRKYFSSVFQKNMIVFPHPAPTERGVSRSSRTLGAGCDGRRGVAGRARRSGRRNRVVSISRRWDQVLPDVAQDDGG